MKTVVLCYLLLFVSVTTDTLRNIYNNHFGKNILITTKDSLLFNAVSSVGGMLFLLLAGNPVSAFSVSGYSLIFAVIFALITALSQYTSLQALATGPMSYSVLFAYLGMIIPTFFGIIATRTMPSVLQIVGLVLMLLTCFLCTDLKKDRSVSPKWLFYAFSSMVGWGLIGVAQIVQQSSPHADELRGFLFYAFLFSALLFALLYKIIPQQGRAGYRLLTKPSWFVLLSGVILGAVNLINIYIAGRLPAVIVFPILNGGVMILAIPVAFFAYREKIDVKKAIGLASGVIAILCLSL